MLDTTIGQFHGDYEWLSNFSPADILFEGTVYPTVEHAYVASKTIAPSVRAFVQRITVPGKAKRFGRGIDLRPDWKDVRIPFMRDFIHQKFLIPEYRQLLIDTGTRPLIEGNYWHDDFWGFDLQTNKGLNWLGNIIMEERTSITGQDKHFIY